MPSKPPKPKPLTRNEVLEIIQPTQPSGVRPQRFTQDTPISTDVWYLFGKEPDKAQELLLTPNRRISLTQLFNAVRSALIAAGNKNPQVIYNQSHVLARLTFEELVRAILPLSIWWAEDIAKDGPKQIVRLRKERPGTLKALLTDPAQMRGVGDDKNEPYDEMLLHMVRIIGYLGLGIPLEDSWEHIHAVVKKVISLFEDRVYETIWAELKKQDIDPKRDPQRAPLWRVFSNRPAEGAIFDSRSTIKADAACGLFRISCSNLRWAVVDSGIDATHPAFSTNPEGTTEEARLKDSRVQRTYDFTKLKELMFGALEVPNAKAKKAKVTTDFEQRLETIKEDLATRVQAGQAIDWDMLEPILRVRHEKGAYRKPENQHGTHVAGILASDWHPKDKDAALVGMCPDIKIYDIRVFDKDGGGDEFTILAALQFLRHMNQNRDNVVVQGVNLSFSLLHVVESYACGATPVCEECTRMVGAGIVVVAAAGNRGYDKASRDGFGTYSDISITDPGNTDDVITVGATHREMPHKYGVSYFSSRGPTGDGRLKPDIVAPGEKITAPIPGGARAMLDGTSMAAPHVSGAAALLMARHKELIGQPRRIKEILCSTATDLGRERSFQGAGLVDVLRALQSV